jgi:hypothetical protein
MVYKFTLLSDEIDDFVRVIKIDPEATFLDLHNAILDSVNYEKNLMTTFLCVVTVGRSSRKLLWLKWTRARNTIIL